MFTFACDALFPLRGLCVSVDETNNARESVQTVKGEAVAKGHHLSARFLGDSGQKAFSQQLPLVAEDYIGIRTILINGFKIISVPR